eukprot:scaffold1266_cov92-Isochrysis_galbana.AAC.3
MLYAKGSRVSHMDSSSRAGLTCQSADRRRARGSSDSARTNVKHSACQKRGPFSTTYGRVATCRNASRATGAVAMRNVVQQSTKRSSEMAWDPRPPSAGWPALPPCLAARSAMRGAAWSASLLPAALALAIGSGRFCSSTCWP